MEKSDHKPWDDSLRKLVRANPQAFVSWILGEAEFLDELPEKLESGSRRLIARICEGPADVVAHRVPDL